MEITLDETQNAIRSWLHFLGVGIPLSSNVYTVLVAVVAIAMIMHSKFTKSASFPFFYDQVIMLLVKFYLACKIAKLWEVVALLASIPEIL